MASSYFITRWANTRLRCGAKRASKTTETWCSVSAACQQPNLNWIKCSNRIQHKKKPILPSCKPLVWGQYADGTSRICDSHKPPQSPSLEALRLWIKGRSSWNFATQKEKKGYPTVLPVCGSIRWNYLSHTCRRHSKKWRILPHPWQFEQSVLFYSVLALSHRGDLSTRWIALRWNSHARVDWPLRSWRFLICPRLPE